MNRFNVFIVLSIVAASALFAGIAMVTPAVAQGNSTIPISDMGNTTMTMDNSTGMTGNSTNSTDSEEESSENGESED